MRRQLHTHCLLKPQWSLFCVCGCSIRPRCYSLLQALGQYGEKRVSEGKLREVLRKRPLFALMTEVLGRLSLLNLSSSILDLSRLQRPGRKLASSVGGRICSKQLTDSLERASSLVLEPSSPPIGCRRNMISSI